MRAAEEILSIITAGIDAVRPAMLFPSLPGKIPELDDWLSTPPADRHLLCIGKAALSSAEAMLKMAPCREVFAVAPFYEGVSAPAAIRAAFGSHPLPDERSFRSTIDLLEWLKGLPPHTRLLVILSGGSSALLFSPVEGVSRSSKISCTDLLIRSGASIHQINTVRKHLSRVKGGQLSGLVPGRTIVLLISDVSGDDPASIGSGPFFPDPGTFAQAKAILQSHGIWDKAPADVRTAMDRGIAGDIPETPKPGSVTIPHFVIASNRIARVAAANAARTLGYSVHAPDEELLGDVATAAEDISRLARRQSPQTALILGGEVTVKVAAGAGIGGRNQHLALLLTGSLQGTAIRFAAAGTDGMDGNSPVAGAWTDGSLLQTARERGLDYERAIRSFDAFHFFEPLGRTIHTGPTGTNVMDLYIALRSDE